MISAWGSSPFGGVVWRFMTGSMEVSVHFVLDVRNVSNNCPRAMAQPYSVLSVEVDTGDIGGTGIGTGVGGA